MIARRRAGCELSRGGSGTAAPFAGNDPEGISTAMRSNLKTLALVAGCALASLAASQCASPKGGGGGSAPAANDAPVARLAPATWTPQSKPEDIAAWARHGCGGPHKDDCLEKALVSVIGPAGVDKAMAALMLISQQDADVANDGHVLAHGIGIAAYQSPETVSETFARCTADFQSGCYHGVVQAYFADARAGDGGLTAQKLNALCIPYRSVEKRWLEFQCAHGIGHGVMAVESHDLLRALDSCDLLTEGFEEEACWGGAFMENVVNATQPHHQGVTQVGEAHEHGGEHAEGHEGHDMSGHEGHDMSGHAGHGGQAAAHPFKALDDAEPLYPCTIVKDHHRPACYLMQTSAILFRNGGDFRDAAQQCARAPEVYRNTCYISLGRDANSWGRGSRERAIIYCTAAPEVGQPYCIVGLVKNIVDVTADARDGMSFCRMAPDNTKPACYKAVGQEIGLLQPTPPGRERACAEAGAYLDECRRGAGLPLVPDDHG